MGYYAGSRWLSSAVALVVIGGAALALLAALEEVEERSEKLLVELTVRNMRTGMQIAMGDAITHGRDGEIATWRGANPIRWLGATPDGYIGDCSGREAEGLADGRWCFDRDHRELVYQPRRHAHLRLEGRAGDGERKQLRWRVAAPAEGSIHGGLVGLRMENVTPYGWFLDYDQSHK